MIWKTFLEETPEYGRLIIIRNTYKLIMCKEGSIHRDIRIGNYSSLGILESTTIKGHTIKTVCDINDNTLRLNKNQGSVTTLYDKEAMSTCLWSYPTTDENNIDLHMEVNKLDTWLEEEKSKIQKEYEDKLKYLTNYEWINIDKDFFRSVDKDIKIFEEKYREKYNTK
jgi:hypothetical protein